MAASFSLARVTAIALPWALTTRSKLMPRAMGQTMVRGHDRSHPLKLDTCVDWARKWIEPRGRYKNNDKWRCQDFPYTKAFVK